MVNFRYYNPAKIVFGQGAEKELTRLLKEEKATYLLMIYSGEFIKELRIYSAVWNGCRLGCMDKVCRGRKTAEAGSTGNARLWS